MYKATEESVAHSKKGLIGKQIMNKSLRILVVEDKPENIEAAKEMLKEHTLTIVSGFDQAMKALNPSGHYPQIEDPVLFDVVLTDLMFPKGGYNCMAYHSEEYLTQEMPYGPMVVFRAIEAGVKNIGLITQGNHHKDPFVFALDDLRGFKGKDVSVVITNNYDVKGTGGETPAIKDWGKLLKAVLGTLNEICKFSGLPVAKERRSI